ncbi:tRNA adenosine(34) deaminase TadA [Candidatus Kapabacteria bacterium]|nr:tRNA adenosine(34) deaminase TadA [Candidatus Kapabacteria bacterium]
MKLALEQASIAANNNEVPVGCVITSKKKIIAKAYNQIEKRKDPTAHAEILAIREASNKLNSKFLLDCEAFVTLEPCSMCSGGLVLSKIGRVYFGAYDTKTGAAGSKFQILNSRNLNHKIEVYGGILELECSELLKKFFNAKR